MKIANADKLKKFFENVVDVKLFTVPEICTIIDRFSGEIPEGREIKLYRSGDEILIYDLDEKRKLDNIFGGTRP